MWTAKCKLTGLVVQFVDFIQRLVGFIDLVDGFIRPGDGDDHNAIVQHVEYMCVCYRGAVRFGKWLGVETHLPI